MFRTRDFLMKIYKLIKMCCEKKSRCRFLYQISDSRNIEIL